MNQKTHVAAVRALQSLIDGNFIGATQFKIVLEGLRGEEAGFFAEKMIELWARIEAMPETHGQADEADPKAFLHYFGGSFDAYILEKDCGDADDEPGQSQIQAYGYASFYGPDSLEGGFISLPEILGSGAELDFHFDPKPLSEILSR